MLLFLQKVEFLLDFLGVVFFWKWVYHPPTKFPYFSRDDNFGSIGKSKGSFACPWVRCGFIGPKDTWKFIDPISLIAFNLCFSSHNKTRFSVLACMFFSRCSTKVKCWLTFKSLKSNLELLSTNYILLSVTIDWGIPYLAKMFFWKNFIMLVVIIFTKFSPFTHLVK